MLPVNRASDSFRVYAMIGAWLVAVALLDYYLPFEVSAFAFYFIPISIAAVKRGRTRALAVAFISSVLWFGLRCSIIPDHYSTSLFIWNGIMRVVSFAVVAIAMARMGAEIQQLRELLPICACCKKIRDEVGYWQQVENYFNNKMRTRFTHGLCPECAEQFYKPHVLFIEREVAECFVAKDAFAKAGLPHILHCVENIGLAVDWLLGVKTGLNPAKFPSPDVLVINVAAFGTEGWAFLNWLRKHGQFKNTPILIVGESNDRDQLKNAFELGVDSFFLKSLKYADLADFLKAARS